MACGSQSHGFISVIGRRRVMEDAVTVAIGEIDSYDFFAVYDGHGGARAADACRERPDEEERVEAAGGGAINWYGCRVLGALATSRSIGDQNLKPFVRLSEPEVTVNARSELDEFIVIATRGLWDVVPNEFACEVVRRCLTGQLRMRFPEECSGSCAAEAATMLAELALARGSKDNISVIVVELKKSSAIIS